MVSGLVAFLLGDLLGDLVAVVLGNVLTLLNGIVGARLAGNGHAARHQLLDLGVVADLTRNRLAVGRVGVLLDLKKKQEFKNRTTKTLKKIWTHNS